MSRFAVAAAILGSVLACSGCSFFGGPLGGLSAPPIVSTTARVRAVPLNMLPFSRSGSGNEPLGSFLLPRRISVKATCVGKGALEVEFTGSRGSEGIGAACANSTRQLTLNSATKVDPAGVNQAKVIAPAGTRWHVSIVAKSPRA